jgi:hypothetical protein
LGIDRLRDPPRLTITVELDSPARCQVLFSPHHFVFCASCSSLGAAHKESENPAHSVRSGPTTGPMVYAGTKGTVRISTLAADGRRGSAELLRSPERRGERGDGNGSRDGLDGE